MKKPHIIRSRESLFLQNYLKTGNATESAMRVYDCKSRKSAQALGSKVLKKEKEYLQVIMDENGVTYGKLIDIAIEKMYASNETEWFDRIVRIGGYDLS